MGGLFRGELMYNNNRTSEVSATDKSGTKSFIGQQAFANLTASGSLSEKVKYDSEVQLIKAGGGVPANCMGSMVRTAQATWWHSDMFSVAIGCSKVKSGGWDFAMYNEAQTIRPFNPANSVSVHAGDPAFSYVPNMASFNPSIELGLHMFGDLTLQILNDTIGGTAADWNTRTQQTWNLEWKGDIAGIRPIIQYGTYDSGHSSHFDVGLMLDIAGFGLTADYMSVSHSVKTAKTGGGSESKINAGNRFSLEVSYAMKGMMTPSLYYSNYMNKPKVDLKANTKPGTWDHEGQVIGVSVALNSISANYSPYVAIDMQSGKFIDPVGSSTKKTKSDLIVRLGATAHF